ncbi:hypothetical protein ABW20_dc0108546 [Dactylellina cionopaga]|nr:hypothetical protein ABW20_dc0108546 [Dactylellina cionopaga]
MPWGLQANARLLTLYRVRFDEVAKRLLASPGLPLPDPTTSFWLLPESSLLSQIQSPSLPSRADIVIVGSGISAVSILRELYRLNPALNVVVLDARGVCTGATGRNGGQTTAPPYWDYVDLKREHGIEAAARIIRFRLRHLEELKDMVREEGDDCAKACEIRELAAAHIFFEPEVAERRWEALRVWHEDVPEMAREWTMLDAETARAKLSIPAAAGAILGPAVALWPYRLCTSVLERLIKQHHTLKVESFTPVEKIAYNGSSSASAYTLTTPRGNIVTDTVVHATNAWASHLVPGLRGKVFPCQGQMSAQIPPEGLPPPGDKYSYLFVHERGLDYMAQRPIVSSPTPDGTTTVTGGEMMLGGGSAQTRNRGSNKIGLADDTKVDYLAASHLSGLLPSVFGLGAEEGTRATRKGAIVKNMWTGIMTLTADDLPFVGKVPSSLTRRGQPKAEIQANGIRTGEWCAVGFGGEGMVNCWGSGTALARMLLGEDVVATNAELKDKRARGLKGEDKVQSWREQKLREWFPAEYLVTKSRVDRADPTGYISYFIG